MKRLVWGFPLALIGILLASLFLVRSYHEFYWSHPLSFVSLTVVGVFCTPCGAFLMGSGLARGKRWLLFSGALVALAWVLAGAIAILLALGISQTGYWGSPPYEYHGDFLVMGLQIRALQLSVALGFAGGLLVGLGLPPAPREG